MGCLCDSCERQERCTVLISLIMMIKDSIIYFFVRTVMSLCIVIHSLSVSVIGNWWCCRTRMTRSHIWSGKLFVCDLWKRALWRNWWRALQQMMVNWSQHISMCSLLHIALLPLLSKSWHCFLTGEWQIFFASSILIF